MATTTANDADLLDDALFASLLAEHTAELGIAGKDQRTSKRAIQEAEYQLVILRKSTHWDGRRESDLFLAKVLEQEAARDTAQQEMQRATERVAIIEGEVATLREARNRALIASQDPADAAAYVAATRGAFIPIWTR